jgi:hypothetical protein
MVQKIATAERCKAELIDLSNYGASFKVSIPLKANDRVKVSISIDEGGEVVESEEVAASVRWMERSAREITVGVQFDIMITDKGFPLFNQCLEYLKTHE